MSFRAKVCPSCRDEYLPQMSRCRECGVDLVYEDELVAAPRPDPDDALALAVEGVLLREAGAQWAGGLADALVAAGIACRIGATPAHEQGRAEGRAVASLPLGVFVGEADLAAARRIDAAFLREQVPDLADAAIIAAGESVDADEGCPACGEPVAADAHECPECGLVFAV